MQFCKWASAQQQTDHCSVTFGGAGGWGHAALGWLCPARREDAPAGALLLPAEAKLGNS